MIVGKRNEIKKFVYNVSSEVLTWVRAGLERRTMVMLAAEFTIDMLTSSKLRK